MRYLVIFLTLIANTVLANPSGKPLANAARDQEWVTLIYDPAYVKLEYPGGDIPRSRGVCTDVVIRAMRDAWDIDLQQSTHRDMKAHFSDYPKIWGLKSTDRNIDHRRVPNLEVLFKRAGASLPVTSNPDDYLPGDIVSFRLNGTNLPHIGIIADKKSWGGTPLVTHNIGWGTQTNNVLFKHSLTGHFRLDTVAQDWLKSR